MLPKILLFCGFLLCLLAIGCGSDDCIGSDRTVRQLIEEDTLNLQKLPDDGEFDRGFRYVIGNPGGAERPTLTDSVTYTFIARTIEGDTVDQTTGEPQTRVLNGLITGWQLGLPLIGRGGSITLYVPSALAYASNPVANLCPSTDLVFEVDLIDF